MIDLNDSQIGNDKILNFLNLIKFRDNQQSWVKTPNSVRLVVFGKFIE